VWFEPVDPLVTFVVLPEPGRTGVITGKFGGGGMVFEIFG
jgi:hypothetical protein